MPHRFRSRSISLVFLVLPFINIIVLSFYTYSPTRIWTPELTNANYVALVDGTFADRACCARCGSGWSARSICVVLRLSAGLFPGPRASARVATIGLFLLIMPLMVSAVIRIFGWLVILGRRGPGQPDARSRLGLDRLPLLYNETAVVIGLVNVFMPFMVLPLMAAIERITPALEEAARNLGASWCADVPPRDPAAEPARPDLRLPAGLQRSRSAPSSSRR